MRLNVSDIMVIETALRAYACEVKRDAKVLGDAANPALREMLASDVREATRLREVFRRALSGEVHVLSIGR